MLLEYSFEVVGSANVEKALASLERRFAQHNARVNAMFGTRSGAGGGRAGARTGGGAGSAASAVEREQSAALRRAEREQIASTKRIERERISSERAVGREQQKQQDYWAKARQKSRERDQHEQLAMASSRADFVKGTVGRGAGRVFNSVKAVGAAGLAATGIGGAALAASAISQATRLDDMARRTAIQARGNGERGMDPDVLRKKYVTTGIATGLDPEAVGGGVGKYVDATGDLDAGLKHMKNWATIAQASGAAPSALAGTTAALRQADITSADDVKETLSTAYLQGKKGSFKLDDQSQYLPALLGRGKDFGAHGREGVKQLGGLLQMTWDQTHDSAEAATGVKDMFSELTVKASDMASGKAFGGRKVNVFEGGDAKKGGRNIRDIVSDVLIQSQGDSSQIEHALGKRAMPAMQGFLNTFKETRLAALANHDTNTVATKKGRDAAIGLWDKASNVDGNFGTVEKDAADAMKGFGVQMEIIEAQVKDVIASEIFPKLIELAPQMKELLPGFTQLVKQIVETASFFANHPFAGLGAAITASILYEIALAGIGKVMATALGEAMAASVAAQALAGGGVGGVMAGARAGLNAGGAVGTVGAGVVAAASVYAAYDQAQDLKKEMGAKSMLDILPGFEGGKFSGSRFGSDLSSPLDSIVGKTDKNMNEQAKADAAARDAAAAQAAKATLESANAMKEAAGLIKAALPVRVLPNTGNSPSPVKS